jgi:hypothetical protein
MEILTIAKVERGGLVWAVFPEETYELLGKHAIFSKGTHDYQETHRF